MTVTLLTDLVFVFIGFSLGLLVANLKAFVPFISRLLMNWLLRLVGINYQLNTSNKWFKTNQEHK